MMWILLVVSGGFYNFELYEFICLNLIFFISVFSGKGF